MILKMFSVYDSASESYSWPKLYRAKGEALRSFINECNDKESALCVNADYYTLFELGEFDDSTGVVTMLKAAVPLGKALEFRKLDPQERKVVTLPSQKGDIEVAL